LADFAQLARGSVGKIERGEQNFTIETLFAIANVLKVEPEFLLKMD
jgi:transcriptional regulator with XRE-family HTH domain